MTRNLRTFLSLLLVPALAAALSGCGAANTVTAPSTPDCFQQIIVQGQSSVPAGGLSVTPFRFGANPFFGFQLTDRMDVIVDWTFPESPIWVYLVEPGSCPPAKFKARACNFLVQSGPGVKPRRISGMVVVNSTVDLLIANFAAREESVSMQVVSSSPSCAALAGEGGAGASSRTLAKSGDPSTAESVGGQKSRGRVRPRFPQGFDTSPGPVSLSTSRGALELREVGFATCHAHPALVEDDRLVVEPLRERGVVVTPVVWDAPGPYPAERPIVIRSCWDYHRKADRFVRWARRLDREGVPLWNAASVVEWNHDKSYLAEFEAKGVTIPRTRWVKQGADVSLVSVLDELGSPKAVVKPLVSASAWRTFVTEARTASSDDPAWRELLRDTGAMVQEFVPEIQTAGEWSLLFFGGEFSHAVLKRPRAGDFRVQSELGGTAVLTEPRPAILAAALKLLALVEEPLLFARVDGVEVDGRLVLMELELIEPALFLGADPGAPARFADAIVALCQVV